MPMEKKDHADNTGDKPHPSRYRSIIRYSILGIVANVLLAAFKAAAGFLAGSIAVILDAVNSLTDVFSSLATIIGQKIATRRPSRQHPYGYGRVEYITSIMIGVLVLAAGVLSIREAAIKVVYPSPPDYSTLTIVVLVVATAVKVVLGVMFIRHGRAIKSQPLSASGVDAAYDAVLTFGTLVCAIVCLVWGIDFDGWVGLVISLFVVKAGVDIIREAVKSIIGERPDEKTVTKMKGLISDHEGVLGVYDLVINSFGPMRDFAACRIEVPSDMTAAEVHEITRHITMDLEEHFQCETVIGIYASNPEGEFSEIRNKLYEITEAHPEILQVHGFYVDSASDCIDFDLVVDFNANAAEIRHGIVSEMERLYPKYHYNVVIDLDYS